MWQARAIKNPSVAYRSLWWLLGAGRPGCQAQQRRRSAQQQQGPEQQGTNLNYEQQLRNIPARFQAIAASAQSI